MYRESKDVGFNRTFPADKFSSLELSQMVKGWLEDQQKRLTSNKEEIRLHHLNNKWSEQEVQELAQKLLVDASQASLR
jgi:hypothetical protein